MSDVKETSKTRDKADSRASVAKMSILKPAREALNAYLQSPMLVLWLNVKNHQYFVEGHITTLEKKKEKEGVDHVLIDEDIQLLKQWMTDMEAAKAANISKLDCYSSCINYAMRYKKLYESKDDLSSHKNVIHHIKTSLARNLDLIDKDICELNNKNDDNNKGTLEGMKKEIKELQDLYEHFSSKIVQLE